MNRAYDLAAARLANDNDVGKSDERHNKGMKLTRVGAGAERSRRGAASSKVAAQLMPGVGPTPSGNRVAEAWLFVS